MINAARHSQNSKTPDTFFGHGVVDISSILPLENGFGLQIPSQKVATTVAENGHTTAKIDVKSNKVDLQITMSYLDVMLEMNSPIPLTCDLDMLWLGLVLNVTSLSTNMNQSSISQCTNLMKLKLYSLHLMLVWQFTIDH